jgi:hypothetical protein
MKSILRSINKIDEFRWMIGTYLISIIFISFVYLIGFLIPILKKVITEYEQTGTWKSISIISSISSVPFSTMFGYFLFYDSPPESVKDLCLIIGIYAGYSIQINNQIFRIDEKNITKSVELTACR